MPATSRRNIRNGFDRYDRRIRSALTKLALIKPPVGSDKKEVKKYIIERLFEFGIM